MTGSSVPSGDLEFVLGHTEGVWREVSGGRIFVTGGTGFIGKWLLETFLFANQQLSLGAEMVVLSRAPREFAGAMPHIARNPAVHLHQGDIRTFEWPAGEFTHAIHGAADVARVSTPLHTFDVAAAGTRRVLEFCRARAVRNLLLVSSGAVYGRQPTSMDRMPETYLGAPATTALESAYGEGKRAAEWLASAYSSEGGPHARIARCFAFVGPHLPLNRHLAVGNFIADVLSGRAINISGDGSPLRSYLYAADMAVWMWTIMLRGRVGQAYNIGSDAAISIASLARTVALAANSDAPIVVAADAVPGVMLERYVPDVSKARGELGLETWTRLEHAIAKTLGWYRQRPEK
jgi:dTDP-glucose 4,6-dehydratase